MEGLCSSPEQSLFFGPHNANFDAVFRSLETRILRFNRKTKLTKTVQKLSKNSRSDQGGGSVAQLPPPSLNTPLVRSSRFSNYITNLHLRLCCVILLRYFLVDILIQTVGSTKTEC